MKWRCRVRGVVDMGGDMVLANTSLGGGGIAIEVSKVNYSLRLAIHFTRVCVYEVIMTSNISGSDEGRHHTCYTLLFTSLIVNTASAYTLAT